MSQVDSLSVDATADGPTIRANLNAILQALGTWFYGDDEPTAPVARMNWVNSSGVWKKRDGANTAWVTMPINLNTGRVEGSGTVVVGDVVGSLTGDVVGNLYGTAAKAKYA